MINDPWQIQNRKIQISTALSWHHPKFKIVMGLLLAGILAGFLLAMVGKFFVNPQSAQAPAKVAPNFKIPLIDGDQPFQLSQYQGQGVVINFWASWCHPCRQEMPLLESTWRTYQDQGIVFVGVNVWEEADTDAQDFLSEFDITYPIGLDTNGDIAKLYTLPGVPTTLFIAPNGTINHIIYGLLNPESLTKAIEDIIPIKVE